METIELTVKKRESKGTSKARALRREGSIPAILYGHGMQPVSLTVNAREFNHVIHTKAGGNVIIQLKAEGVSLKESTCLIKDLQHNPVTDKIDHVDFSVISLTEKIEVRVNVVLKNVDDAPGIKEGGVIDLVHHEIEIECLPTQIPDKIEIDVSAMKINDLIHLKEVRIPEGVTVLEIGEDEVIVALHPPRKDEEIAPAEEGEATQPEVIEKGKKLEEGEEAPEAKKDAGGEKKPAEKK